VVSIEVRSAWVKKASQLRIAKARPVAEAPAFMISGRGATIGLGLGADLLELEELALEIKSSCGPHAIFTASIHSWA
jgi:hypothetical protein